MEHVETVKKEMEWSCTRSALADLEKLLTCRLCENIMSDPCTLENCDDNFCRECIERELGSDSKCPNCGAFSWLKDLRTNHQLSTTITMVIKLSSLIASNKEENMECDSDVTTSENTIIFDSPEKICKNTTLAVKPAGQKPTTTILVKHNEIQSKENKRKMKDVLTHKKNHEPVKKYSLRGKRQASCLNSTDIENGAANSNGGSSSNTSGIEVVGEKITKPSKRDNICVKPVNDKPFTCIQPRLRSCDEKARQKKIMDEEALFDKIVNMSNKKALLNDKENVTLNVKRRKMRRRNTGIKQYLVEIKNLDSSAVLTDTSPQRFKKSTMSNGTISPSQDTRNKRGETPLHIAAIKGDVCSALDLINEGANPNAKDNAGWTPLHEACNHGHVDVVELFLDNGALLNIPGFDNDTPLHDAVANGRLNVAKLLVKRGASLTARNKQGLVPMDYAAGRAMKNAILTRRPTETSAGDTSLSSLESITKFEDNSTVSKVVLGTALNKREREILGNCVPCLGGSLVNEFNESVTHVVTSVNENGLCPRTLKYFSGILTGKWIVRFNWISDCVKERLWVSEDAYEVCGTAGKLSNAPKKARNNLIQQLPPLFEGCSFYLRGSFNPPTPNKQDLLNLIKLGGGVILHREPKMKDDDLASSSSSTIVTSLTGPPEVAYHARANSSLSCCTQFIIYDPTMYENPKMIYSPVLCTAPVTWLVDCISSFQLLDIPDDT